MIRQATPGDQVAFKTLTDRAYAPYVPMLGRKPTPMERDYRPVVAAGSVWIEDGFKGAIVFEPGSDHLLIYSIVVDPTCHGQGVGQKLLRFAVERAERQGLPVLRLCTGASMKKNIQIYEAFGFVETRREDLDLPASPTIVWMEMQVSA